MKQEEYPCTKGLCDQPSIFCCVVILVYQQNIFHKTVAGLEYLLRDILKALLKKELVCFSRESVKKAIESREWRNFDDVYIEGEIRELRGKLSKGDPLGEKIVSIHTRKPLTLVYEWERFVSREDSQRFADRKGLVEGRVKEAMGKYEIDEFLWHIWDRKVAITNLASHKKITAKRDDEEILQSVHLYDPDKEKSQAIMENESSLMSIMADQVLYVIRVYVLLPEDKAELGSEIQAYFEQKLS